MLRALLLTVLSSLIFLSLSCGSNQQQSRACSDKGDCLSGEYCLNKVCDNVECKRNGDCTGNTICLDGKCQDNSNSGNNNSNSGNNNSNSGNNNSGNNCNNPCSKGQSRCSGNQIQLCLTLSSGCTSWGIATDCPRRQACKNNSCVAACQDNCSQQGVGQCIGVSGFQVCERTSEGCLRWGTTRQCPGGKSCKGGSCATVKAGLNQSCQSLNDCQDGLFCGGDENGTYRCRQNCSRTSDCSVPNHGCYLLKNNSKGCYPLTYPPSDAKCQITIENGEISGSSGSWNDGFEGGPDPYVVVEVGSSSWRTYSFNGQWKPVWNETTTDSFSYREILEKLDITMWDKDPASDDVMATWGPTFEYQGKTYPRWVLDSPRGKRFTMTAPEIELTLSIVCKF